MNTNITIEEMITAIFTRIDGTDSRDEIIFQDWIYDALREIGHCTEDIVEECLPVSDFRICKPCNYGALQRLDIQDHTGGSLYYQFSNTGVTKSEPYVIVHEDDSYFNLSTNASNASQAYITYYSLPIGEDGKPVIREEFKTAIIAYVQSQYIARERFRAVGKEKNYAPMSEVDYWDKIWMRELGKAKGRAKAVNPELANTIANKWMTMIPNFKNGNRRRRIK